MFEFSEKRRDCSEKWRAVITFLRKSEGANREDGYLPMYGKDVKDSKGKVIHKNGEVVGVSGVTISTGIDLGQQRKSGTKNIIDKYINEFGNSDNVDTDALIQKLEPYFGKKKKEAVDALNKTPLQVSREEAKLLEQAFGFDTQARVAKQFDRKNTQGMKFKTLPKEAQTIMIDFSYQYGTNDSAGGVRRKFWNYVYEGEWQDLANWLKSNPDPYKIRRKREGDLLQHGIGNGGLPASGNPCASGF